MRGGLAGRGLSGGRRRRRRCLDDLVDVVAVEAHHHGRLRQRDHARLLVEVGAHAGELARPELAIGIVDDRPDGDQARLGIDLRIDAGDRALEIEMAFGQPDAHRLAQPEIRQLLLGNGEIDPHPAQVLERRDRLSRLDVLADVDLRDAGDAGERRQDGLLRHARVDLLGHALGQGELVLRGLQVGRGRDLAREEHLGAVEGVLVDGHRRFRRGEAGALERIVDLDEHRARGDLVVPLEIDLP